MNSQTDKIVFGREICSATERMNRAVKRSGNAQPQFNGHEGLRVDFNGDGQYGRNGSSEVVRRIQRSISYMLEHLDQPLHVSTLAAAVNISPSHYSALFKRLTGSPPIDFFIHLRMEHARHLFDGSSLNVKEVAAALGYEDPFYFSRIFKSVCGVAPSWYRTRLQEPKSIITNATDSAACSSAKENHDVNGSAGCRGPDGRQNQRLYPSGSARKQRGRIFQEPMKNPLSMLWDNNFCYYD